MFIKRFSPFNTFLKLLWFLASSYFLSINSCVLTRFLHTFFVFEFCCSIFNDRPRSFVRDFSILTHPAPFVKPFLKTFLFSFPRLSFFASVLRLPRSREACLLYHLISLLSRGFLRFFVLFLLFCQNAEEKGERRMRFWLFWQKRLK